jgi:hypothetical protein
MAGPRPSSIGLGNASVFFVGVHSNHPARSEEIAKRWASRSVVSPICCRYPGALLSFAMSDSGCAPRELVSRL